MPRYDYACSAGHVTEKVRPMRATHPRTVRCGSCPRRASRVFTRTSVVDDFPEHFNWSFGCVVKNRQHYQQIQKERGLQDWAPVKDHPLHSRLRKEGFSI